MEKIFFYQCCEGRKRELIIASILYAIGGLTTASAPTLGVLLAGRVLYGLGIGWVSIHSRSLAWNHWLYLVYNVPI